MTRRKRPRNPKRKRRGYTQGDSFAKRRDRELTFQSLTDLYISSTFPIFRVKVFLS